MLKVKRKTLFNYHCLSTVFLLFGFLFFNPVYSVSNEQLPDSKPDSTIKLDSFSTGRVGQPSQGSPKQNTVKSMIVKGLVSDENEEPIIGLSVSIKGLTTGTNSDANGKYALPVKKGQVLVFSFLGYTNKEVEVGDSLTINVSMKKATTDVDEVVVGCGPQKLQGQNASPSNGEVGNVSKKRKGAITLK